MEIHKIFAGLLTVMLTTTVTQATEPVLSYEVTENELILTYSGILYQSKDAVNWAEVKSASSPYIVTLDDRQLFFCSQSVADQPVVSGEDFSVSLTDDVSLDMVWVEPGTFLMGSPEDELGRDSDEIQHEVTLTQEYWLGKYEVTQAQYEAVMGKNPSEFKGADLPVGMVNWFDAIDFCAELTIIEKEAGRLPEGYEYTLPTEAQWEYACRAGTTMALNSEKNLFDEWECFKMDEVGWYVGNSDNMIHPVELKLPNAWEFYDMHGNVLEWCLDRYEGYAKTSEIDPIRTGGTGSNHVVRGGSCLDRAYACRSAYRFCNFSSSGNYRNGFRVALPPIPKSEDITIPLAEYVDLKMVWIEPGTFIMGSPEDELGRKNGETQHQVTLTKGYWLGKYEVTQAQYEAVIGMNPSYFKGADLAVEQVSWDEAMDFCAKLTTIEKEAGRLPEGYEYSLPTEAQWEYACRAGTMTALNSGKNLSDENQCPEVDEVGWYWYNGGKENYNNDLTCTHLVGQKQPNDWGLYDMHGNVYEWCLDWYGAYPTSAVKNPAGPDTGSYRVVRSGSWGSSARYCRSAYRCGSTPNSGINFGFRVALAPIPEIKDITIPLTDDVSLDMVWVEAGTFLMGSPAYELGRYDNEVQHEVTLTKGYWMGKYEVTQAQYEAIIGTNPSNFKGANLPVEMVSWDDAMEFCAVLTVIERVKGRLPEGYEYTLPTEAQWEYACRAGTTTALNSGKNLSGWNACPEMVEVGWYDYNSDDKTHPVGQKKPNAWELYDMHGNVREWCLDWYGDHPDSAVVDPAGPNTGSYRVLRDCGWNCGAFSGRSAYQYYGDPSNVDNYIGFRVALAPIQ